MTQRHMRGTPRLILAAALLGCVAAPSFADEHDAHASAVQAIDIDARTYWYLVAMERTYDVTTENGVIAGELQQRHGRVPFKLRVAAASDRAAKTAGYRDATKELIGWLTHGTDFPDFATRKLQAYTGQPFTSAAEWQAWYSAHAAALEWSDERNQLTIRP